MAVVIESMSLEELKVSGEAPGWLTDSGYETLRKGYLLPGETPRGMYRRISKSAARYLSRPELEEKFYQLIDRNWLCPATPVASNAGTERGLPISCYGMTVPDSLDGIYMSYHETAMLTKGGGGIGKYWGSVRGKGTVIAGGGVSDGIIPWLKVEEATLQSTAQAGVRRGSGAQYLDIDSPDINEFIELRRNTGDISRRCLSNNFHHAVCITDDFMHRCMTGDKRAEDLWIKILTARLETGEPYIMFKDTANKAAPLCYKSNRLDISTSQLCVAPETLILTNKGWKKIADLDGQDVMIWNGKEFSKSPVRKTSEKSKLIKVVFSDGSVLECTQEHKFHIQEKGKGRVNQNGKVEIKDAIDLLPGDALIKCEYPIIEGGTDLPEAYTQGFFSEDGCRFNNANHIDLYGEKIKLLSEMSLSSVGTYNSAQDRIRIVVSPEHEKFMVPLECGLASKLEWLAGLLDSDGCSLNNGTIPSLQVASINFDFLNQIRLMLQTMGISSKVAHHLSEREVLLPDGGKKLYKCQRSWRLLIASLGVLRLIHLGLNCRRLKFIDHQAIKDAVRYVRVVSVTDEGREDATYCFNEPKRHMGILNGVITGNCNEIYLHTDEDHTFVCCLSSMNLARYDEWKGTNAIKLATWFLDGIMTEFIEKAKDLKGFERAVRFARKGRALGLGVLGWHTLLQSKMIPFESFEAMQLNAEIFRSMDQDSLEASRELASVFGEPEWTVGFGIRNTHRMAVAPTVSNSLISGGVSQGIEPLIANYYAQKGAKGTFIRKNLALESLLQRKGKDSFDVWEQINRDGGSVRGLSFLSADEKEVFATAREINQFAIVKQAAQRQKWIDQGQSVNLFFQASSELDSISRKKLGAYIHEVHLEAYTQGLKGLYYLRPTNVLNGDEIYREGSDCKSCEA